MLRTTAAQPNVTMKVADVAPMDCIGVVTEMIVGELLQPFQFGVMAASRAVGLAYIWAPLCD